MYAYPMDSVVTYDNDGIPQFDRGVDSSQLRALYHELMTDGVLLNDSTNLQVTASANMNIVVAPGLCNIQGCIKKFTEDTPLTIAAASTTMGRIDTVVARLDLNTDYRDIGLFVIQGTPASVPIRPELTRNSSVYEIGLADITISPNATSISQANISDTRLDTNRCGIISAIAQFDTTKLYEQIQADLTQFQQSNESEFEQWFDNMKGQLGDDAAGNLQLQIDEHTEKSVPSENGAHGFRYFEGKLQAHIYDEESMTLKWVNVPYATDEELGLVSRTLGYTVSKNYLPNNNTTKTVGNVQFTVNSDKSVTANGTNSLTYFSTINLVGDSNYSTAESMNNLVDGVEYILSGCPQGGSESTYLMHMDIRDKDNNRVVLLKDIGNGVTFTHKKDYKYVIDMAIGAGVTVNNLTFKPMISKEGGEYEPYVPSVKSLICDVEKVSIEKTMSFKAISSEIIYRYDAKKKCEVNLTFYVQGENSAIIPSFMQTYAKGKIVAHTRGTQSGFHFMTQTLNIILEPNETLVCYVEFFQAGNNGVNVNGFIRHLE